MRVKSHIFVNAYLRLCTSRGAFATVIRKGDSEAGMIALKVYHGSAGAALLMESRDTQGQVIFRDVLDGIVLEHAVDARLNQEVCFDTDLWIIEVENSQGQHFLSDSFTRHIV